MMNFILQITRNIPDYVIHFIGLMLDVCDMFEKDSILLREGQMAWTRAKLYGQRVHRLSEVY